MTDLTYHLKLINYLKQNPPIETDDGECPRLNTSSALEIRKEQDTEDESQEGSNGLNRNASTYSAS